MKTRSKRTSHRLIQLALGAGGFALAFALAGQARASEGGASLYLLGSGGPAAAVTPPLQGVYMDNTTYVYSGSAGGGKTFEVGGNVVAGLRANIVADFPIVIGVPSTNVLGGTLLLGGTVPFGMVDANVNAIITGPFGHSLSLSAQDSAFVYGDPIFVAGLGWAQGDLHEELSSTTNIPIGYYRDGALANLSFHRWADDVSYAMTWHDAKAGWDLSGKAGLTFNGRNAATDYTTGTEFHLEASLEKSFTPQFAIAVQAYWFDQVSGDSGGGDTLGAFEGRVTGVGGTAAYTFHSGLPLTVRVRGMAEFGAVNRPQGELLWLELTVPIAVKMPARAPAP